MTETEERSSAPAGGEIVKDVEALAVQARELADRAADLARVAQELADRSEVGPRVGATATDAERTDLEQRVAQALSEVGDALDSAQHSERAAGVSAEWLAVRTLPDGVPTRVGWRGAE